MLSAAITLLFILVTVFAPWVAPHTPLDLATVDLLDGFIPPVWEADGDARFLLGTDDQGRDILSTMIYGSRISLSIGIASVLFAMFMGISLGLISGYVGGTVDAVIMRIADVQLSFPAILIALLIDGVARGILPRDLHGEIWFFVLVFAIGISGWVGYARTVRGSTLVEKNKEYVQAARVIGISAFPHHAAPRAAQRHGAGPGDRHHPPGHRDHHRGDAFLPGRRRAGHLAVARHLDPGRATISFSPASGGSPSSPAPSWPYWCLAVNLLGDWLRDALNPKLR